MGRRQTDFARDGESRQRMIAVHNDVPGAHDPTRSRSAVSGGCKPQWVRTIYPLNELHEIGICGEASNQLMTDGLLSDGEGRLGLRPWLTIPMMAMRQNRAPA